MDKITGKLVKKMNFFTKNIGRLKIKSALDFKILSYV